MNRKTSWTELCFLPVTQWCLNACLSNLLATFVRCRSLFAAPLIHYVTAGKRLRRWDWSLKHLNLLLWVTHWMGNLRNKWHGFLPDVCSTQDSFSHVPELNAKRRQRSAYRHSQIATIQVLVLHPHFHSMVWIVLQFLCIILHYHKTSHLRDWPFVRHWQRRNNRFSGVLISLNPKPPTSGTEKEG